MHNSRLFRPPLFCHVERRGVAPQSKHLDISGHSPSRNIPAVRSQRRTRFIAVLRPGWLRTARRKTPVLSGMQRLAVSEGFAPGVVETPRQARGDRTMHNGQFTIHDYSGRCSSVTLSGASKTRSRKVSTYRNIHPCGSHGFPLIRPSRSLDSAALHSG